MLERSSSLWATLAAVSAGIMVCAGSPPAIGECTPPGGNPSYCFAQPGAVPGPCGAGQAGRELSAFTTTCFVPDGSIREFIDYPPDPQEYFVVDVLSPSFGAIKAAAVLTPGVLVTRDNFPAPGSANEAMTTGFGDPPCVNEANQSVPTGFNIGRVFVSYNPRAYNGEGAYFLAMDVSAPITLPVSLGTQPIAFDVDGDGNRCSQTELADTKSVSEAPITVDDFYTFVIDTDRDGIIDVRIRVVETAGAVPATAWSLDQDTDNDGDLDPQIIPDDECIPREIHRYVQFEDLTGTLMPPDARAHALFFLNTNEDGVIDHRDIGVDTDVELVIRHPSMLPKNSKTACCRFTYLGDTFDDEELCGGAEDRIALDAAFPVPDIEVTKEARCVDDPDADFRRDVEVTPGSTVVFRVTIQNWGNRALDVNLTDLLTNELPATAVLEPNSCATVGSIPPGVDPDFCTRFQNSWQNPGGFTMFVGEFRPIWAITPDLPADREDGPARCLTGPGEKLVFTFRVRIEPPESDPAFCDELTDLVNAVSVTGSLVNREDTILPESPPGQGQPEQLADGEEEACPDQTCCNGIPICVPMEVCQGGICTLVECPDPACIPGDTIGDAPDELLLTVFDRAGVEDTLRERVTDNDTDDDNRVSIEINCRSVTLAKEVREVTLDPNAPFTSGELSLDLSSAPAEIEYRYTVVNSGEVDELVTLTDPTLCADVGVIPGASFLGCPICEVPSPGELTPVVAAGTTFQTSCKIRFATQAALQAFTRADDPRPICDGNAIPIPVLCYRNCAEISARPTNLDLLVGSICPDGEITDDSLATVCFFPCEIEVSKQVQCLDNCNEKNVIGVGKDFLMTTRDSCVEFVVNVRNTSADIPICRLRISDSLSNQVTCIEFDGPAKFSVNGVDCGAVPPGFNVNGAPFEWNPMTDCGNRPALGPGETLTITFNATIPENAPLSCGPVTNSVEVDGASDCRRPQQPGYTCMDDDAATLDLLEPSLVCVSKEWAFQWDSDADCAPEEPFSAFNSAIDLRDKVFPVQLRLKVKANNTGQVPLEVLASDAQLACVCGTPGVVCSATCEIGDSKILSPGEMADWFCDIRVDTSEAMRDVDACDGAVDSVYHNHATVNGRLVRDDTNICVPEEFNIPGSKLGDACRATIQVPEPCDLSLSKQVKCADDPDASYAAAADALAGSLLTYRIQVRNDDTRVKIPRVCIDDALTCSEWLVAGSVNAEIAGVIVTACMADFEPSLESGDRECYTFAACRAAAPWLAPGETLTIKFDVRVPVDFDEVGTDPDCENEVTVDGYSEICVPPTVQDTLCDTDTSRAEVDVRIPEMNCDKQVGADLDNDGDLEVPLTHDLSLPCDTVLPFTLEYKFTATNKGETPLVNVQVCDIELVAGALAAGLIVGPCNLCNDAGCAPPGDTCALLPNLAPNASAMATCRVFVPNRTAWELFAARDADGDANRYSNSSKASAHVNAALICDFQADTRVESDDCQATAFLAPLCHLEVTKKVRCLDNCTAKNPIGADKDVLQAAPGSCVEFEFTIANTSTTVPICRLRLSDTLSHQPAHIGFSGGTEFRVGALNCPVPPGFNVNGTPFDWDPTTCGLPSFGPGQVLTVSFNATIPESADPNVSPLNTIRVDGAPTCPAPAPNFCCQGAADAQVDILRPRVTCTSKQWAFQWDSDGDCEPDEPFSSFSSNIDLSDKVFPVRLQLKISVSNTGEVPLDVTASDPTIPCACATPGVHCAPTDCELGTVKRLAPGTSEEWNCQLLVETADAMRDVAACDGTPNLTYVDTVSVSGMLVRGTTETCVPQNRVIPGDATCSATITVPAPCDFTVDKLVKCADDADSAYTTSIEVVPGSVERFRIRVVNQSARTKIPRVCLRDLLGCCTWLVPDSLHAEIAGVDVTSCLSPEFENSLCTGDPECHTFFDCRPAAPWIDAGETLTLTFDTRVPSSYSKTLGVECSNRVEVEGFEEACPPASLPDAPCDTAEDHTEESDFDVRVPELECSKAVGADLNNDGGIDVAHVPNLLLRCDTAFPFTLEYKWTVTNTGEADLIGVQICDPGLRADAVAAGLTIVSCDLAPGALGCAALPPLAAGDSAMAFCRIRVPSRAAWESFAGRDGDGDAACHTNESSATGGVDGDAVCAFGAETDVDSPQCQASACLAPMCQISVSKKARCLNNCEDRTPFGDPRDSLPVVPGGCMQFEFDVTNTSATDPVCRLRICDTMTGQPANITFGGLGSVHCRVGNVSCPVPAGFNVNGTCFDWSPQDCGLTHLDPGATLTCTFDATVPSNANPAFSPINTVTVSAAPTCKGGGAQFCCQGSADAAVDILRPSLRCDAKEWAYQWDSDGDCEPESPFSAFSDEVDLRDKVFPVLLRLRISASNNGEVPVNAVAEDPTLLSCATTTPGISIVQPATCELGVRKNISPGASATWTCDVRIEKADAMRALAACDGTADSVYTNKAIVSGLVKSGLDGICVPNGGLVAADNAECSAILRAPGPCRYDLAKTVVCTGGCESGSTVGGPAETLEVLPGAFSRFNVTVTNTDPMVKIPRICITDVLSCADWICPGSIRASLAGTDLTAGLTCRNDVAHTLQPDGQRCCITFGARPAAPWIAPGETFSLSFDVRIPEGFDLLGRVPDCLNEITVESFSETCAPPECLGCVTDHDSAAIDVLVPKLECNKSVAVDLGNDGTEDISASNNVTVSNPPFPVRLIYQFVVRNTGDAPMANVSVCDERLVADARAAGIAVTGCDLCNEPACDGLGDHCKSFGSVAAGSQRQARCQLVIADQNQWDSFAGRDSGDARGDCYVNRSQANGSASGLCIRPGTPPLISSAPCEATVCMNIVQRCPVTKAVFDIWNQNERRFSGTERCILSWDQTLLSRYTEGNISNHFQRPVLQTDRGRARIDGVASENVCGTSMNAPLLGVAARVLHFGRGGVEMAGRTLVGSGTESGTIFYDPVQGSPAKAPKSKEIELGTGLEQSLIYQGFRAEGDTLNRAGETQKGSLLVFPKVEIKWDATGQVIQDTYVSLSNDYPEAVRVQLYFVNGDQETDEVVVGGVVEERAHLGCNWVDNLMLLTANQPIYWSVATGDPQSLSPFSILDPGDPPGRPDLDPRNLGGRVLRGYVLAWAVNPDSQEIRWNHLIGEAMLINYVDSSAWDYRAWAFQALAGADNGSHLEPPSGRLDLNGIEYDFVPASLLLDFVASGATIPGPGGASALVDTDLTLWVATKDLRNP